MGAPPKTPRYNLTRCPNPKNFFPQENGSPGFLKIFKFFFGRVGKEKFPHARKFFFLALCFFPPTKKTELGKKKFLRKCYRILG